MGSLLKIGELAKLLNCRTSVIRFYEKEGLIKPSKIDTNGYRLYDFEQLDIVETILLLRQVNVPIDVIKNLFSNYSIQKYEKVMDDAIEHINKEMSLLKSRKSNIKSRLSTLKEIKSKENTYSKVHMDTRSIVVFHTGNGENFSIRDFYTYFDTYDLPISLGKEDIYFVHQDQQIFESGFLATLVPKKHRFEKQIELPSGDYLVYGCFCSENKIFLEMNNFDSYLKKNKIKHNGPIILCEKIKYLEYNMNKIYFEFQVQCI